jgi:cbb3-type cytochrome oxidase subunit 3
MTFDAYSPNSPHGIWHEPCRYFFVEVFIMRKVQILLLALTMFLIGSAIYVYADENAFRSDQEAYQVGYKEGYNHGVTDRDMNTTYDYQRNFSSGLTYDSYVNQNYRDGFHQGYTDGFQSRSSRYQSVRDPYARGGSFDGGSITVFTNSDFKGSMREFGIGQYPDLRGKWNDSISSVEIHGAVRVILFDRKDFQGQRLIVESSMSELKDLNFKEKAASMIVEPLR